MEYRALLETELTGCLTVAIVISFVLFLKYGMLPYIIAKHTGNSEEAINAVKYMVASGTLCPLATIASIFLKRSDKNA